MTKITFEQCAQKEICDPPDFSAYDDVPPLATAVAAGGRALVAWHAWSGSRGRVIAAAGRAGGAWDRPVRLSSPTRPGALFDASLDAAGAPRVLWAEARVRGAQPRAQRVTNGQTRLTDRSGDGMSLLSGCRAACAHQRTAYRV